MRAHPRSRGEHQHKLPEENLSFGSSPLARGTQHQHPLEPPPVGLIPARAGNTRKSLATSTPRKAHPRSRGEHQSGGVLIAYHHGSSPLARGTRR